mgnify:CR=1 FL=1
MKSANPIKQAISKSVLMSNKHFSYNSSCFFTFDFELNFVGNIPVT